MKLQNLGKPEQTGTVSIKNLKAGDYYVYETETATGYNLEDQKVYYPDSDDPNNFAREHNCVYLGEIEDQSLDDSSWINGKMTRYQYPPAKLTIKKVDYDNPDLKLNGVEFAIFMKDSGWLGYDSQNKNVTYENSWQNAYKFKTGTAYSEEQQVEGEFTLNNLRYGDYYVFETSTGLNTGYSLKDQIGYKANTNYEFLNGKTEWQMKNNSGDFEESVLIGSQSYKNRYTDVKKSNGVIYEFIRSESNNTQGLSEEVDFIHLDYYKGSVINNQENMIYYGTNYATYTIKNKKNPYINLNGYVWVENDLGKNGVRNNVYTENSEDELFANGMTVNLFKYGESTPIATTTTFTAVDVAEDPSKKLGHYEFIEKITREDLPNCYVEFVYDNTKYVCVETFEGGISSKAINSKAKEEIMESDELEDDKLTGTGKAVTSPQSDTDASHKLDFAEYYNIETNTVENINLGLLEKINHSISVSEKIEYVKVVANGSEYTYKYPENATENEIDEILRAYGFSNSARFQTGARAFTTKVYEADVAKNKEQDGFLNVYAVYEIKVTNNSNDTTDEKYVEKALYLNSLENKYDKDRYEVSKVHTSDNNDYNSQFENWDNERSESSAYYKLNSENSVFKDGIGPAQSKTTHIQFKVTDKALDEMITKSITGEQLQSAPTTVEVKGYHEYLRTDKIWNRAASAKGYFGCKGNYQLENKYYVHKSTEDTAKSHDWYFILEFGKTREISGTVFEDIRKASGENTETLGNGIWDNTENKVKNVTVELYKEDGNIAEQYEVNGTTVKRSNAMVTTGADGKYTFKGVPTGKYYIQFTYGDGTQKIGNIAVNSNDYKSTIINTENDGAKNTIRDAIKNDANQDGLWYLNLNDKKYSTAVDDFDYISAIDEAKYDKEGDTETYYKDCHTQEKSKNVHAKTPKITIPIENDKNNNRETLIAFNGRYVQMNTYDKFNFGIIKSPKIIIETTKEIDNITLTNQVGTNIISANPKDKTASYVSAVQSESGESAKIEIDLNNIYGSSLEATYKLTLENKSEIDYIEPVGSTQYGDYYRYGTKTQGVTKLKTVTVEELQDNMDTDFDSSSIPDEGLKVVETLNTSKTPGNVEINKVKTGTEVINPDGSTTRATRDYISMTKWSGLERSEKTSITYSAKTLLSADKINTDSSFTNDALITKIKLEKLTTLNSESKWHEEVKTNLTIFGPTGANRSYEAFILPGVILLVMGVGIVLIKKFVL